MNSSFEDVFYNNIGFSSFAASVRRRLYILVQNIIFLFKIKSVAGGGMGLLCMNVIDLSKRVVYSCKYI